MPAYRDKRDGRWRYRKWVTLPKGTRTRIAGTPPTDTKVAAEAAERAHIERVLHPERARATTEVVPERKEMPTVEEFADRFMREYLPRQKPTERKSKEYILRGSILPFFGAMRLDEIDQTHVNAFIATQAVATKTLNNRLSVLATMLRYAGPSGCKLIPETKLRFHVKAMSPDIVAVPIAEVGKLYAGAGVDVPVSESGVTMPWHSLRHTFGTECAARGCRCRSSRS